MLDTRAGFSFCAASHWRSVLLCADEVATATNALNSVSESVFIPEHQLDGSAGHSTL
jgi:hypothetical protein